ncbi:MAG: hypothetical protein ACHQ51_03515 [Elusimicrobiota bacterium]
MPLRGRPRFGFGAGAWVLLIGGIAAIFGTFFLLNARARGRFDSNSAPAPDRTIESEIAGLPPGHPWAGRYSKGIEHLEVSPTRWCRTIVFADILDNDPPVGRLVVAGTHLRLNGTDEQDRELADLVVVPWGERVYLVPTDRLTFFAGDVTAGIEPGRTGGYYLRDGDERKPAPGRPSLPPSFRKYLLNQEISAAVLRVESPWVDKNLNRLIISAGRRQGVLTRMVFHFQKQNTDLAAFAIEVRENESMLLCPGYVPAINRPRAGWKATTGAAPAPH